MKYAKEFKCVECGKQAVMFFGAADPDCESVPLCQEHLDESKRRVFDALRKLSVQKGESMKKIKKYWRGDHCVWGKGLRSIGCQHDESQPCACVCHKQLREKIEKKKAKT